MRDKSGFFQLVVFLVGLMFFVGRLLNCHYVANRHRRCRPDSLDAEIPFNAAGDFAPVAHPNHIAAAGVAHH